MHTLTLEQLRATTDAGGIAGVTLVAEGCDWIVQYNTRKGEDGLLAKARRKEPRRFANPLQALTMLHELGLAVGAFNVEQWRPSEKSSARSRPDRAEALKRTHKAAEYDKWFRAQVQEGLTEADDPHTAWVLQAAAKADMQRQRDTLQKLAKGR